MRRRSLVLLVLLSPCLLAAAPIRPFHIPALYHVGFWVRDMAKTRAFYERCLGFDEPYDLSYADGKLQMAVTKVNERQVLLNFPNPSRILPNGDNLDHLGLETDDLQALHDFLVARGLKIGDPHRARIGDLILGIKDPDGHTFEVTQFEPEGQLRKHQGTGLPEGRISTRLRSATLEVADLAASLAFYRDLLGFVPLGKPAASGEVRLRVPDGDDWVVLRPTGRKTGDPGARSVPEYSLEVPDAAKAAAILAGRAPALGLASPGAVAPGLWGERTATLVDPDGTRVVLAEPVR